MIKISNMLLNKNHRGLRVLNRYNFATQQVKIPFLADSIKDVTVKEYLVKVGDFIKQDDEVMEVESHKGSAKIRSSVGGKVVKLLLELESDVAIGAQFMEVDPDAPVPAVSAKPTEVKKEEKLVAETKDVSSKPVAETKDVSSKPEQSKSAEKTPKKVDQPIEHKSVPLEQSGFTRQETKEKLSRLRKTVAERLKESQNTNAHVTTMQEIDMSEIMKIRKELGEEFQKKNGVKLGFMSFFIKAVTRALQERPMVNSAISGNEIVHRNFIDISVAVSSPKGLVVPVIRDTQFLGFAGVEQSLIDLSSKASSGNLSLEEMTGGTFTISNGGVFGSMLSIPVINPPQSAVLGMHNIVNRPVVRGDQIVVRPIMYVSMSYDHRLLDGREGAGFLKRVADLLEDPRRLLLEF